MTALVLLALVVLLAVAVLTKTVRIVPQARAGIVERFGKYKASLPAGLNIVVPVVDNVRYMIDLREQVVSFPPQPVITEDNLVVSIDTVIYFQVTDPVAATYEIANYIQAVEQLTMTTLRNIVGGMTLEQALTSRDEINNRLRGVLDEATGKWGIRVNRVELKGIDPPPSIKDSMEKQMRADRDKRAAILTAEGQRQSAILTAEGGKQAAILNAEGDRESLILRAQADRESRILKAQGEGQAIQTVFQAIHDGRPDQALLAYQYLQMMPKIAEGDANKVWIVPSEIGRALEGLGSTMTAMQGIPEKVDGPRTRVDMGPSEPAVPEDSTLSRAHAEVAAAIAAAEASSDLRNQEATSLGDLDADARLLGGGHRRAGRGPRGRLHVGGGRPRGAPGPVSPWEMTAIFLAGMAAGTINTVVGSGTLITFPTLLAFGVPPVTANVSNTLGLVPGSLSGAIGYRRELRGQRARLVRLGSASVLGGVTGAVLLLVLPEGAFTAIVPALIALGCVLVLAGPAISRRVADRAASLGVERPVHGAAWVWVLVYLTGVYGGYFGAAQGVLLMAVLGVGLTETMQRNNATKNVLALLVNLVAAVVFVVVAHIDYRVAGLIAVGSVIGGQIGATVGRRLPGWALRGFIVLVGVAALVQFIVGG